MFKNIVQAVNELQFKDKRDREDMETIHHLLFTVLLDINTYSILNFGKPIVITDLVSTVEEDISLGRDSDAHRTKRGADLRSWIYEDHEQKKLMSHFNKKYASIASISRSDLKPRLMVLHGKGKNKHFHVALNYIYGDR